MWPSADALPLTAPQRNALRRLVRGGNTAQKMALRARIVLLCAQGLANHAIARQLNVNRKTVMLWRKRFAQSGLDGLRDQTRPGRKPALSAEFVQCILDTTLHEKPPAATHWSTRTIYDRSRGRLLARASPATVGRVAVPRLSEMLLQCEFQQSAGRLVDGMGFEPTTSALRTPRSPN